MKNRISLSKNKTMLRIALLLVILWGVCFEARAIPPAVEVLREYEQAFVNRVNDSDQLAPLDNHQSPEYSPESGQEFSVKSYWVSAEKMNVFEVAEHVKKFPIKLSKGVGKNKKILFLVHPESEDFYREFLKSEKRGPDFLATATASSRTLLVWAPEDPNFVFFGKLSLDREIGGVVRTIPASEVARSVGVTKILEQSRSSLPKNFKYLPEFFGAVPKGFERGGMILREISQEIQGGREELIPLFALYTQSPKDQKSPIEKMLSATRMSPEEFIRSQILRPFAELWVELVLIEGVAIEAHSQNLLMGLDHRGMPNGDFYFRDFGGFNIALEHRRIVGRPMPADVPIVSDEQTDYHQVHHEKALRQSLENYFEGGFLYGLGLELERLGLYSLRYSSLKSMFRNELEREFSKSGIQIYDSKLERWVLGLNYEKLAEKIIRHRSRVAEARSTAPKCSTIVDERI